MEHKVKPTTQAITAAIRQMVVDADTAHTILGALLSQYSSYRLANGLETIDALSLLDQAHDELGNEIDRLRAESRYDEDASEHRFTVNDAADAAVWGAA